MGEVKLRKVNQHAHGHTGGQLRKQDSNPGSLAPRPPPSIVLVTPAQAPELSDPSTLLTGAWVLKDSHVKHCAKD